MKQTAFILLLLIGFAFSIQLHELTAEDYDTHKQSQYSFIMLYAPWCGYCTQFKPIIEEAAAKITDDRYFFGRVDCTKEMALCSKLKVNYYPTLTFYKYGHSTKFDGERTADGLIAWMKKHEGYMGTVLKSQAEIDKNRSAKNYSAIAYFQKNDGNAFIKYMIASERPILTDGTPTFLVNDPALFGGRAEGTIEVYNSQNTVSFVVDDTPASHESTSALANRIFNATFPEIIEITDENYSRYRRNRRVLFLSFIEFDKPTKESYLQEMTKIAQKFPQHAFGYVDYTVKKERLLKMGGTRQLPNTILRVDFNSEDTYVFDNKPYDYAHIAQWIEGIDKGEIKPEIVSEVIPETQHGPVYKVVGLTFDEIVLDEKRDVIIQYYIDWCKGCKYLECFDKVGEALKDIPDVRVGKLDYNINDVKDMYLEIYGNPTIAFYPRNDKKHPIVYSGSHTAFEILSWFKNHTSSAAAKQVSDLPLEPEVDPMGELDETNIRVIEHDEL